MRKYRHFIAGLIVGAMLLSVITVFAGTQTIEAFYNNIKISIDGKTIDLKDAVGNPMEPFIYNGTTYVPARAIAEALGMEVKFNETTNTVELNRKEGGSMAWDDSNVVSGLEYKIIKEDALIVQVRSDNTKYVDAMSIAKQFNTKDGKGVLQGSSFVIAKKEEGSEIVKTIDFVLKKATGDEVVLLSKTPVDNSLGTLYLIPYDDYKTTILPRLIEAIEQNQ